MQGGVFLLAAGDFLTVRNDSYLNVKCRKRVPQPMGVTTDNFSSFSSQRKRFVADTSRNATLFLKKNPERPSGVRFFSEKFLAASSPNLKRSFRKKREKIGRAAQCGRHRKRLPSSGVLLHPLAGRRSPSKLRREWVCGCERIERRRVCGYGQEEAEN